MMVHIKNCSYECAYDCAQVGLWYTTQHRTILTVFSAILQTIVTAQNLSVGGTGVSINH